MEQNYWRKCSVCKKEIKFNAIYQLCSVSTCKKAAYCTVECWDTHLPVMNHKDAWAEENTAPSHAYVEGDMDARQPKKILIKSSNAAGTATPARNANVPMDVLIVASKLKLYVKEKHDISTSANVMDRLSDMVRYLCDDACDRAKAEGRKTLMDRDFV